MKIPWKLKSRLFRVLTYFPDSTLYFAQKHITRHVNVGFKEPYIGWEHHRKVIQKTQARTVIEFGGGKSLAQNLYLAPYVESQTVVDLYPMMEIDFVNAMIDNLVAMGAKIDGRRVSSQQELEEIYGIRYIAPLDMCNAAQLTKNSFDLCISTNTLEHIPLQALEAILKELRRVLKTGGSLSAMIDYSDHYSHSDPSIGRLNFLQFDKQDWQKHNHSNHYQNRLRHKHYGDLFLDSGFGVVLEDCTNFCDFPDSAIVSDLLSGDSSDNATTGFWQLSNP